MRVSKNKMLAEVLKETPTTGGLILSANDNLEKFQAKIVQVGPDVKHFEVGDIVRFNPNSVTIYDLDQGKSVFLREDQDIILRTNDKP